MLREDVLEAGEAERDMEGRAGMGRPRVCRAGSVGRAEAELEDVGVNEMAMVMDTDACARSYGGVVGDMEDESSR